MKVQFSLTNNYKIKVASFPVQMQRLLNTPQDPP